MPPDPNDVEGLAAELGIHAFYDSTDGADNYDTESIMHDLEAFDDPKSELADEAIDGPDDLVDLQLEQAAGIQDEWEDVLCEVGDREALEDRWDLEDAAMDDAFGEADES